MDDTPLHEIVGCNPEDLTLIGTSPPDNFTPNTMRFAEYEKKVIENLPRFTTWWSSVPDSVKAYYFVTADTGTFRDWHEEFWSWMANGAPETWSACT